MARIISGTVVPTVVVNIKKSLLLTVIALISSGLPVYGLANTPAIEAPTEKVQPIEKQCPEYLRVKARKLHSDKIIDLCELTQGKAVLIVNTASNCGFTPQFKALEALHSKYQPQGLVVIGFPSDDFFQEENDEAKTADVCFINYGVSFTMLATSAVRGHDANSVFKYLSDKSASPKWNFYKYLISPDGKQVQQFNSKVKPDSSELNSAIDALLLKHTLTKNGITATSL